MRAIAEKTQDQGREISSLAEQFDSKVIEFFGREGTARIMRKFLHTYRSEFEVNHEVQKAYTVYNGNPVDESQQECYSYTYPLILDSELSVENVDQSVYEIPEHRSELWPQAQKIKYLLNFNIVREASGRFYLHVNILFDYARGYRSESLSTDRKYTNGQVCDTLYFEDFIEDSEYVFFEVLQVIQADVNDFSRTAFSDVETSR